MYQSKIIRLITFSIFSTITLSSCSNSPEEKIVVDLEKCNSIKTSIANITKEIKDMQIQEASLSSCQIASNCDLKAKIKKLSFRQISKLAI